MTKTGPRQLLGPVCFSLLFLAPLPALAQSLQEALIRAKPAAALVVSEVSAEGTLDCDGRQVTAKPQAFRETGTGWFIAASGWLITNAHVVSNAHEAPPAVEAVMRDDAVKASCPMARSVPKARVRFERSITVVLPNGKRLPARVVKYSTPAAGAAMSARDLALLKVEAENVPTLPLASSAQAKIGDRLHVIGFPNVVMTHELLKASAGVEASVTGGAISGFKEDVNGQPVIQTDASAAGGDSGGPVVSDRGEVVGVMTFVQDVTGTGAVVQGFNFIIPSATVREFLKDTGVTPGEPGKFTRAWSAGLGAFFAGDHAAARPHLAEADRLVPDLPEDAVRLLEKSMRRVKENRYSSAAAMAEDVRLLLEQQPLQLEPVGARPPDFLTRMKDFFRKP